MAPCGSYHRAEPLLSHEQRGEIGGLAGQLLQDGRDVFHYGGACGEAFWGTFMPKDDVAQQHRVPKA